MVRLKIVLAIFFTILLLHSCNSDKRTFKKQAKQLLEKADSLEKEFNSVDYQFYKDLYAEMRVNCDLLADLSEEIIEIDPDFIKYCGPYSSAAKGLSRAFRKHYKKNEEKIALSKRQAEDLLFDIKNNNIPTDSIQFYLNDEIAAVNKLSVEITSFKNNFEMQESAFNQTKDRVNELVIKLNSKSN